MVFVSHAPFFVNLPGVFMDERKELTLDEQVGKIRSAISDKLNPGMDTGLVSGGNDYYWIVDLYDTHAILNKGDKWFDVSYSFTVDGLEIGELIEVERDWKPVGAKFLASFKRGARNSRHDSERLQGIHDYAVDNGALCEKGKALEIDPEETYISFGGDVKAVQVDGGWKVKAPLVVFTNPDDLDLTGDYFDASTDFDFEFPGKSTTYFNHGMDSHYKRRRLEPVTLTKDEYAVWAEGILRDADEYDKMLIELGKAGKLGMSSGVPGHLVEREAVGKAMHIKMWPLGKDASYTHTPAEPKTRNIIPLKSLLSAEQEPEAQAGDRPVAEAQTEAVTVEPVETLSKEDTKMELTDEMKAFVAETVTEASKAAVEAYRKSEPAPKGDVQVVRDEADQSFKNLGEFFMAVKVAEVTRNEDKRLLPLKASGLNEAVPADGGYLVPPQTAAGIQTNMFGVGEILSRVSMDNVTGNSMTYNQVDETSRASSRFGGVIGYWLAEAATKTASAPKFKQLELKLKKVAAVVYATDELLADASALQGWITRNVPDELRFQAEAAIFYGDGVGKPMGIVGAPGTVSVTRVDGSTVQLADIVAMYERRLGNGPFAWYVNRGVIGKLIQLAGTYQYLWMPAGSLASAPNQTLMGLPVIESEYASALGTVGDIVLADMSKYQAIQKGGVEAATSIHVKFLQDETAFRFVYRIDGAPMLSSAVTPHKGSLTMSPFVTLSTSS